MAEAGIITRTRDRLATLPRTLDSIIAQTFTDWHIALVNDGGKREPLEALLDRYSEQLAGRITVVHNETSKGRWAAANAGVTALDTRYLTILDDDDTWHPDFLARTADELTKADDLIGGVMTRTVEKFEKIVGGKPVVKRERLFRPELTNISIAHIAQYNQITTNSLLYRRKIHERVGLYNDSLPVLGDWDFYLRLLRHYDIRLIDDVLAFWHKRLDENSGEYANSDVGGHAQQRETDARIRNRLVRQDMDAGIIGMGTLVALGRQSRRVDDIISIILRRYAPSWGAFSRRPRWLRRGAVSQRPAAGNE